MKIRYYINQKMKQEITNEPQNLDLFYVVISIYWTDSNYYGSTVPFACKLSKKKNIRLKAGK
ncbi:hypothetical protein [Spiroplasma endosymbiont of Nebria brevicollis]|uniref:hypothetical protein n=1 Tax=Spiroplasma endosymbiont of Nebria brevicollis TaxID=3066284 RepID=UPI00313DD939